MQFRSFLEYYENELNYLIESGKELKKLYPMMSNFDFSNESNDPDVKKMIEGTAFLNANLQKRIDEKNVELSQEILNSIYPYFNRPTPSVSIFQVKNSKKVCVLPQYSKISSQYSNKEQFTFLSTHPIRISAFAVDDIKKVSSASLPRNISKLTSTAIEITIEKLFEEVEKEMVFYINKMENAASLLYETIFTFYKDKNTPVFENDKQIGEIEFFDDHNILPIMKNENTAYNPVIDFNVFKEKFFFFKIKLTQEPKKYIHIPIKSNNGINVSKHSLLLNCMIGVNLIEKMSDPIAITHTKCRYKLFIKNDVDIYAIHHMKNLNNQEQKFINYFSLDSTNKRENDVLWYYKKDHNINSSTFLYFFDESMEPKTVYAKLLCVQKHANELISENEEWRVDHYNLKCVNLKKPSKYYSNANHSDSQRKLVAHLNINYYGLETEKTLEKLKSLFALYSNYGSSYHYLNYITDIQLYTKMIPINGAMTPKTFVTIKSDTEPKAFLLARVISKLIYSTISMNKKLGITLIKNETGEIWKEWDLK